MHTDSTANRVWTYLYIIGVTTIYGLAMLVSGIGLCYSVFALIAIFSVFASVVLAAFALMFVLINAMYLWWLSRYLWTQDWRRGMYQRNRWIPVAISLPFLMGLMAFFVYFLQGY
jgi:hypothetical protein